MCSSRRSGCCSRSRLGRRSRRSRNGWVVRGRCLSSGNRCQRSGRSTCRRIPLTGSITSLACRFSASPLGLSSRHDSIEPLEELACDTAFERASDFSEALALCCSPLDVRARFGIEEHASRNDAVAPLRHVRPPRDPSSVICSWGSRPFYVPRSAHTWLRASRCVDSRP